MTRWLMPDRTEAVIDSSRTAEDGYVWLQHPELGLIQMPDIPSNLTEPEPPDGTIWYDPAQDVIWQRADDWPPEHQPECHWYSTAGAQNEFWPDVCIRARMASPLGVKSWLQLTIPEFEEIRS